MVSDPQREEEAGSSPGAAPGLRDDAGSDLLDQRQTTVAGLSQPIRGGVVSPSDLSLAEALLLLTLTTGADEAGVIGPTHGWKTPPI